MPTSPLAPKRTAILVQNLISKPELPHIHHNGGFHTWYELAIGQEKTGWPFLALSHTILLPQVLV